MITNYNNEVDGGHDKTTKSDDSTLVAWSDKLIKLLCRSTQINFEPSSVRKATYRPFCTQYVYYSHELNERQGQLSQIYPEATQFNLVMAIEYDSRRQLSTLITDSIPDLHVMGATQVFPLYTWEPLSPTQLEDVVPARSYKLTTAGRALPDAHPEVVAKHPKKA